MNNYRRMRRQARQIRRGGMQPMMVINADSGQFPIPVGVLLARFTWRYRSELAPLGIAAMTLVAACWTHATLAKWWALILIGSTVAGGVAAIFGSRFGLAPIAERAYAATATVTVGVWLALATLLGPFTPPLPRVLGIGTMVLGVPWWAHRRRRAKVRVERKLAAWPDVARAIGLIGSEVMSATVDVWGWRARFRLARGQTIADVTARIPAIESGLALAFHGGVLAGRRA